MPTFGPGWPPQYPLCLCWSTENSGSWRYLSWYDEFKPWQSNQETWHFPTRAHIQPSQMMPLGHGDIASSYSRFSPSRALCLCFLRCVVFCLFFMLDMVDLHEYIYIYTYIYIYMWACVVGEYQEYNHQTWANRTRGYGNTWTSMDIKVQMVQWPNRNGILANQRRTGINALYRWIISKKPYICSSPGLSTPQHWGWIVFETTNRMISMPETIDFPLKHGVSCKICLRLIQWNMEPDLNTLDDKVIEPTACWALISKATLRRQGV